MTKPELIRFLLKAQVLKPEDIVDRGVKLIDDHRDRYTIIKVMVDGQARLVVKMALNDDGRRYLQQEILSFKLISSQRKFRGILPPYYASDSHSGLLVMGHVGNGRPLNEIIWQNDTVWLEAAGELGRMLGALHRIKKHRLLPRFPQEIPWALELFATSGAWRPPSMDNVMRLVHDHALLRKGLNAARKGWRRSCLIHGDLKWDNCLVDSHDHIAGNIRLIDWELAVCGDPGWDVAGVIGEFLLLSSDFAGHGGTNLLPDSRAIHEWNGLQKAINCLVDSYMESAGLKGQNAYIRFIDRLPGFIGARLFQTALEVATVPGSSQTEIRTPLQMAETIFHDKSSIIQQLFFRRGYEN